MTAPIAGFSGVSCKNNMQLPGLFPDYFAVGLRKTKGWLTFSRLWLSVISNAKPDLRDIRDPEKKRAAQGRTAQVTEGTPKAKVQRRGNARGSLAGQACAQSVISLAKSRSRSLGSRRRRRCHA